jgi:hypothetical protein
MLFAHETLSGCALKSSMAPPAHQVFTESADSARAQKPLALEPSCNAMGMARRFLIMTAVGWSALGLYFIIDCLQPVAPTPVVMPSWVPFWPAFTLPYLGMLLMTWLLPITIREPGEFRACVRAFVYAFLLVAPWWLLAPTTLQRPEGLDVWWSGPWRWLGTIDPPNNVMPCAHGIGPLVAAWYAGRDHPGWRWPLAGILMVGLPSIALVWQHRPLDIVLGLIGAAAGIGIAEALKRREANSARIIGPVL